MRRRKEKRLRRLLARTEARLAFVPPRTVSCALLRIASMAAACTVTRRVTTVRVPMKPRLLEKGYAATREEAMTVLPTLLILLTLASSPAHAQSCDPVRYPGSCRDKIMQYVQCTVMAETYRLRSLPGDNAQAVGNLSRGDTVYISDTHGSWIFVQGEETFEGKTEKTDGGGFPVRRSTSATQA